MQTVNGRKRVLMPATWMCVMPKCGCERKIDTVRRHTFPFCKKHFDALPPNIVARMYLGLELAADSLDGLRMYSGATLDAREFLDGQ